VGERQFGPYRLVRQIAVGGMAEIHLAKTTGIAGFEKYVAVKMIHPNFAADDQFIQMLVDEAKIAVQLTHGNIAQTFDLGRVGDTYYITMEYVDGADLYKILRRASEQEIEMPLDVCAFIGKEISSALDHAHRKRDHTGKSLGIVHRDVSPQNVLVSYSGEVKLVDFGIAKAAMKVRQTAVGVIKGKYYYMSPEQAWGDPIDHRSDIFSAGIVLYEMITGQMLYLEEDLHKLLEMARSADIAPPSKLRRGVPPQLERIVMHALEKVPGERYQSAGDLATDLERFLHAYSPVFTASKLSTLVRQVVGDPLQVPDDPGTVNLEFRDGVMSTHPIDDAEVAHATDRAELRDENSVIFRVSELEKARSPGDRPTTPRPSTPRPGTPQPVSSARPPTPRPVAAAKPSVQRITRPADPIPLPPRVTRPADSLPESRSPSTAPMQRVRLSEPTEPMPARARLSGPTEPMPPPQLPPRLPSITQQRVAARVVGSPSPGPRSGQVMKPREPHEDTRRLESAAPVDPMHDDSSGLLLPDGSKWDDGHHLDAFDDELENIGERTLITGAPTGFMMDVGDDQVEATLVTSMPTGPGFGDDESTLERHDDAPTLSPEPAPRARATAPAPAALSAKIHAPAVSELRKPRPSRRTPGTGAPTPPSNVLHAIVSSHASEPMPVPRPAPSPPRSPTPPPLPAASQPPPMRSPSSTLPSPSMPMPPSPMSSLMPSPAPYEQPPRPTPLPAAQAPTLPESFSPFSSGLAGGTPGGQVPYSNDASGLPMGIPTPPGMPPQPAPGIPPHLQQYLHMQGIPPNHPQLATQMSPHGYPQMSPSALYQFQPAPQQMSLTSQMRLFEVDELPPQYQLGARRRWFTYVVSGALAVLVAAAVTFFIIRSIRETAPRLGNVIFASVPDGATVSFDGTVLSDKKTPFLVDKVQADSVHTIKFERHGYQPHTQTFRMPSSAADYTITARLTPITGRVVVFTRPSNAEIYIDDKLVGKSPMTVPVANIETTSKVEVRLKDYKPYLKEKKDLEWSADGRLDINHVFER
jgi:serine/threonine protein kinase